jgi:hypothetical protein
LDKNKIHFIFLGDFGRQNVERLLSGANGTDTGTGTASVIFEGRGQDGTEAGGSFGVLHLCVLLAIQVLHGLTFGGYWVSVTTLVSGRCDQIAEENLRQAAQRKAAAQSPGDLDGNSAGNAAAANEVFLPPPLLLFLLPFTPSPLSFSFLPSFHILSCSFSSFLECTSVLECPSVITLPQQALENGLWEKGTVGGTTTTTARHSRDPDNFRGNTVGMLNFLFFTVGGPFTSFRPSVFPSFNICSSFLPTISFLPTFHVLSSFLTSFNNLSSVRPSFTIGTLGHSMWFVVYERQGAPIAYLVGFILAVCNILYLCVEMPSLDRHLIAAQEDKKSSDS